MARRAPLRVKSGDDPLRPSPAILAKLGSIVEHVEELLSPQGHAFDRTALEALLADEELRIWMAAMRRMALLPVRR